MSPRRLYAPTVLLTLAAGGLAFFAASRSWATVTIATDGLPSDAVELTGADAQPLIPALAVVVVTASLAVLASSGCVRRLVGVLTVLVALTGAVVVVTGGSTIDDAMLRAVQESPAFTGTEVPDHGGSVWRWVALAGFVLAMAAGAVTTRFALLWPGMSSRYEAPAARPAAAQPETGADMWKALDEGRDPTQ